MFSFRRPLFRKFGTRNFSSSSVFSGERKISKTFLVLSGLTAGAVAGSLFYYTQASAKQGEPALNPNAWKKFYVDSVEEVSHNTKILHFKLETPDTPLGMPVASCILTKAPIGENGTDVIRPYTPITPADTLGHFDLMVKSYPNGVMSKHITNLKSGDFLEIKGPLSKIPYKANMKKRIGMIAGGTGITPMLQVLNEILKDPKDQTEVSLVFANVTEGDILLKKKLDDLASKHKNFKVYYVLEKPPTNWTGGVGFVNESVIRSQLPPPSDDSLIMVCGPPGMMKAISGEKAPDYSQGELDGLLKNIGYNKSGVFKF